MLRVRLALGIEFRVRVRASVTVGVNVRIRINTRVLHVRHPHPHIRIIPVKLTRRRGSQQTRCVFSHRRNPDSVSSELRNCILFERRDPATVKGQSSLGVLLNGIWHMNSSHGDWCWRGQLVQPALDQCSQKSLNLSAIFLESVQTALSVFNSLILSALLHYL